MVTGVFPPSSGEVLFEGRSLTGLPADRIFRQGLARTFQHPHLFKSLTVLENVLLGRHRYGKSGFWACGLQTPKARREEKESLDKTMEYLDFVGLADSRDELAGRLPLGRQRYVEVLPGSWPRSRSCCSWMNRRPV